MTYELKPMTILLHLFYKRSILQFDLEDTHKLHIDHLPSQFKRRLTL